MCIYSTSFSSAHLIFFFGSNHSVLFDMYCTTLYTLCHWLLQWVELWPVCLSACLLCILHHKLAVQARAVVHVCYSDIVFPPLFKTSKHTLDLHVHCRNCMADFGGEIMAEVLAQRALEKPVIPLIPITTSSQYRHTEHDRDYKNKVYTEDHAHIVQLLDLLIELIRLMPVLVWHTAIRPLVQSVTFTMWGSHSWLARFRQLACRCDLLTVFTTTFVKTDSFVKQVTFAKPIQGLKLYGLILVFKAEGLKLCYGSNSYVMGWRKTFFKIFIIFITLNNNLIIILFYFFIIYLSIFCCFWLNSATATSDGFSQDGTHLWLWCEGGYSLLGIPQLWCNYILYVM